MMVHCLLRRQTAVVAAAVAAAAVALALISPAPVVGFVNPGAALSTLPVASSWRSTARLHSSVVTRPISARRGEKSANGRWCRIRGGVASLRAEVLPEGGVSPCVIKVSLTWIYSTPSPPLPPWVLTSSTYSGACTITQSFDVECLDFRPYQRPKLML